MEEIWKDIKFTDTDGKEYDYTGLYQISNMGRVRSIERYDANGHLLKERVLKSYMDKQGYLYNVLCKNGKTKNFKTHRLVAHMFVDNPKPKEFIIVNHKSEVKNDNVWTNLEWCDFKYNSNYGTCRQKKSESMKGFRHTEETKRKMSEARRGEKNYFYGKHHTEESKNKLSKANKGRKTSEETKKKLSEVNKGSKNPRAKKVRCIETGQVFDYIREANEFLGKNRLSSGISKCCKGKLKTYGGYHWEYVEEDI